MKGQASYPFSMIEAGFTFLILISVIFGAQSYIEDFMREETADVHADRIKNAAMAVDTLHQGHIKVPVTIDESGYEYRIESGNVTVRFGEVEESVEVLSQVSSTQLEGPSEYEEFSDLCISKEESDEDFVLAFDPGECPTM